MLLTDVSTGFGLEGKLLGMVRAAPPTLQVAPFICVVLINNCTVHRHVINRIWLGGKAFGDGARGVADSEGAPRPTPSLSRALSLSLSTV